MNVLSKSVPVLVTVLAAWSANTQALNPLWFLDHSPARNLTEQDLRIMTGTLESVLADAAVGESRTWKNPETGSSGEVRALKHFEHHGMPCKRIGLTNQAKGNTQRSAYDMCQVDGEWKVLGMPE